MTKKLKQINIKLNEKDISILEDVFFVEVPDEHYIKIRPRLLKIWGKMMKELYNKKK